ncbi:MAG TPA: SUMF1/EgtB/PvdO family nonheme iron enzyme [Sandaracinaceae bacterium LLY-WYZ-13_1]|nr:SUMF1/EgtB/PvdO family nonheme iron enzyme [Sandaracinaceae bacterium LLY-WYZ-13_1]
MRSLTLVALLVGCTEPDVVDCGAGTERTVSVSDRHYCVHDTSAACPARLPHRYRVDGQLVCASLSDLGRATLCADLGLAAGCAIGDAGPPPDAGPSPRDGGRDGGPGVDGGGPDGGRPPPDAGPPPTQASCEMATAGCGSVRVEGGSFEMGDPALDASDPVQDVALSSGFWIDAYEVTVGRFARFWDGAEHPAPSGPVGYPGGRELAFDGPVDAPGGTPPCNWQAGDGEQPINCVSFWTALAFCVWDGGRLPTEAEWEYVARGRAVGGLEPGRRYPWGDEAPPDCDRAAWVCGGTGTRAVGSFEASAGVYDLAGNVAEWTADRFVRFDDGGCWGGGPLTDPLCLEGAEERTVRGGSYGDEALDLRSARRITGGVGPRNGFRCVRSR